MTGESKSTLRTKPETEAETESKPEKISADKARGGEIVLRTKRRRYIFLGGLIGMVLLAIILRIAGFF